MQLPVCQGKHRDDIQYEPPFLMRKAGHECKEGGAGQEGVWIRLSVARPRRERGREEEKVCECVCVWWGGLFSEGGKGVNCSGVGGVKMGDLHPI